MAKNCFQNSLRIGLLFFILFFHMKTAMAAERFFNVQAVDTVKYSRDVAKDMLEDESFDEEINKQVSNIAATGATHIALGTPYDEEFYPFLRRWVEAARNYNLKVWFRGNLSGWEEWFGYDRMSREEHTKGILQFIEKHSELFENGDIFTSCPECENGGPGDPRTTGDVEGFRKFLISEYSQVKNKFSSLGKYVNASYYSMNGDVAKLVMDKETTKALDGVVTIDHYVKDSDALIADVNELHTLSGGKIMLGEIGAPIPDIHGEMTEQEQADWINDMFRKTIKNDNIVGINYWVNLGGSTAIWRDDNSPKPAVTALTNFYKPHYITGKIVNDVGIAIDDVEIRSNYRTEYSKNGTYSIPLFDDKKINFVKDGYISVTVNIDPTITSVFNRDVVMNASNQSILYKFFKTLISIYKSLWI